jgi:hypothetical protein
MFKPLGKNLLIDILKTEQKGFVEFDREGKEKKTLSYAIVKDKGDLCRKDYNIGDKIVFIAEQEYPINNSQALLFDEDVIGIEELSIEEKQQQKQELIHKKANEEIEDFIKNQKFVLEE